MTQKNCIGFSSYRGIVYCIPQETCPENLQWLMMSINAGRLGESKLYI